MMSGGRTTQSGVHGAVFKKGSTTYFNSSLFFPEAVRRDVYILYGFVRTADDFVDRIPQDGAGFRRFAERFRAARAGAASLDVIVDSFVELERRRAFDPAWADAFLRSMEMDLVKSVYADQAEILKYIYGSAEVIGLFLARIMDLPPEAEKPARLLGRAMQYVNFIRDIAEDLSFNRCYLPLVGSGLDALAEEEARRKPEAFCAFVRREIDRYLSWQKEAEAGYRLIPRRSRVPVRTAADMYKWTAGRIRRDPFIVYARKVKPSRVRIFARALGNAVRERN